ncbi:hypothetical protein C0995_002488 [Termitomyces sp. Mi166|nr:hypothetical protein C0995_002488 [Termitomyces sp. Mi166\
MATPVEPPVIIDFKSVIKTGLNDYRKISVQEYGHHHYMLCLVASSTDTTKGLTPYVYPECYHSIVHITGEIHCIHSMCKETIIKATQPVIPALKATHSTSKKAHKIHIDNNPDNKDMVIITEASDNTPKPKNLKSTKESKDSMTPHLAKCSKKASACDLCTDNDHAFKDCFKAIKAHHNDPALIVLLSDNSIYFFEKEIPTAQCTPDTTTPKSAAINLNNQHRNNLEAASTLLQGLNLSGGLFEQAVACEAPPAPIEEDVCSEYMLRSYINELDVGTAPEQANPEFR